MSWLAADMGDVPLARQALAGWERDLAAASMDPAARRALYAGQLAMAEQRWDEAIRLLHQADAKFAVEERFAMAQLGRAHDMAGRSDSAVAYYERFIATPDPFPIEDARALAQIHRRLGELYEAGGKPRQAMEHYGRFAGLWAGADAVLQPQVTEVKKRLERLRAQVG